MKNIAYCAGCGQVKPARLNRIKGTFACSFECRFVVSKQEAMDSLAIGEELRDVAGYEDLYAVTNLGRVWCHAKQTGDAYRPGLWLKGHVGRDGYPGVLFSRATERKHFLVHRLVIFAFLGDPPEGHEVNHKNGIKTDNYLGNLEWVTRQENHRHKWDTGLIKYSEAMHAAAVRSGLRSRLFSMEEAEEIRRLFVAGRNSPTNGSQLAKRFGVNASTISKILRGESYQDRSTADVDALLGDEG